MIITKKIQYDVLKQLLEMKDSDEDYELWMKELEIEKEKRDIRKVSSEYEHPLSN